MPAVLRIGGAAGFSGDRTDAAGPVVDALIASGGPACLIFETLAERTLALAQLERRTRPEAGYEPLLDELLRPVLADVSCLDDALLAEAYGADYLSTTLAGYVPGGRAMTDGPDLELVAELVGRCRRPVLAEGRFQTPDEVAAAFSLGAYAVVVGGAITRPEAITRRLVAAVPPDLSAAA